MSKSTFWPTVDADCVQRFESARLAGEPVQIAQFLPPAGDVHYHATLEELVLIDLEVAWRDAATGQRVAPALRVEDYVARFPTLAQPVVLSRLVHEEYVARHRAGETPQPDEFVARFGEAVVTPESLARAVAFVSPAPVVAAPSQRRGRYVLQAEYARGGMGAVWVADDPDLGREVAVKELHQAMVGRRMAEQRFVAEARIAAQLEHPGIVPIYDVGELAAGQPYFAMKLVRGQTMDEAINAFHARPPGDPDRPIEQLRLINIFIALTRAVAFAHSRGVVHRDLKPSNVLLGDYGETVLLDWGLARNTRQPSEAPQLDTDTALASVRLTRHGTVLGTPAYMSPEHASGDPDQVDEASDQYSLGVMLYQLLSGKLPFEAATADQLIAQVRSAALRPPPIVSKRLPRALAAICLKAMAHAPADRYPSVDAMTADIERFTADEPVAAWRAPWWAQLARWTRRHRTWVIAGAVAVVIGTVGLVLTSLADQRTAQREEARVTGVRAASEAAATSAADELRVGRLEAAVTVLQPAVERLAGEEGFDDQRVALSALLEDTQQMVRFTELRETANERLFLGDAAGAYQAGVLALVAIDALSHADWWARLPIASLAPGHQDAIRYQTHELMLTLADLAARNNGDGGVPGCAEAVALAQRAAGFRAARSLSRVAMQCGAAAAVAKWAPRAVLRPRSANDYLLEGIGALGVDALGETPLEDGSACEPFARAVALEPDAYWSLLWRGRCEERAGQRAQALQAYDHAVAVRREGWLGHALRGGPLVVGASEAADKARRGELLRLGLRSIRRATDLEPYRADVHWLAAITRSRAGALGVAYLDSAIRALELEPPETEVSGPVEADRQRRHRAWARTLGTAAIGQRHIAPLAHALLARVHLAEGDAGAALREADAALAIETGQPQAILARGEALLALERPADALAAFVASVALRPDAWRARMGEARSRSIVASGDAATAAALEAAEGAATTRWHHAVMAREARRALPQDPTRETASFALALPPPVSMPLLNGDFEQGLASAWGLGQYEASRPVWWNSRTCASVAYVTRRERHGGASSLYVYNPSKPAPHVYGTTSQDIPIARGAKYQVRLWAKAKSLEPGAFFVIADKAWNVRPIALPAGTYDWREFTGTFQLDTDVAHVRLLSQDLGAIWLDDIVVERLDDDTP